MHQCTNVPIYQCTNVPMHQCTNVPMYKCTNAPMYQCTNVILGNWSSKVSWLTPALTLPPLQFTAHCCKPIVPAQVQYRRLYHCTALMYHCTHTWSHHWCAAALTLPPASSCTTSTLSAVYQQTSVPPVQCTTSAVLQQCTTRPVQCTSHTCAHPALDPLPTIRLLSMYCRALQFRECNTMQHQNWLQCNPLLVAKAPLLMERNTLKIQN